MVTCYLLRLGSSSVVVVHYCDIWSTIAIVTGPEVAMSSCKH